MDSTSRKKGFSLYGATGVPNLHEGKGLAHENKYRSIIKFFRIISASSLKPEDKVTHGIYTLFKDSVRQQFVQKNGKIVGVINLNVIFNELLEVAGPECHINW